MEPITQKNKSMTWILVAALVLIAIVIFMVRSKNMNQDDVVVDQENAIVAEDTTEGAEDTTPVTTPVAVSVPAASMSYQQALLAYKDRRIQIDKNCQAIPNNVTYKNGTSIMIDNRAPVARNLNINGAVSIKGYGFKIIKLSSATLPKTILVDCGQGQNVATILLQK